MKNKSDLMLSDPDLSNLHFQANQDGSKKKGFSYYLPVILLAFIAITVIAEVKYRVLIDEFLIRYLYSW